jgi:AraC-like DNA-binding protein
LEEFVRFYVHRQFHIISGMILHPVAARPTPMIEFDFGDPVDVFLLDKGVCLQSPPITIVGPQTYRRVDMQLRGRISSFVIMFQPDGLQRLFSLPMQELTDIAGDAHSVLGSCMSRLWQVLGNLASFESRVRVVNEFLLPQAARSLPANGISKAVTYLVHAGGCSDIRMLADGVGLSARHFARRFLEHAGVSPKLFARIVRFQAALETKALCTGKSWTEIAHNFGYYDQMHMIHDFKQLAGGSPKEMLAHLEAVFVEPIRQIRSNSVTAVGVSDARLTL